MQELTCVLALTAGPSSRPRANCFAAPGLWALFLQPKDARKELQGLPDTSERSRAALPIEAQERTGKDSPTQLLTHPWPPKRKPIPYTLLVTHTGVGTIETQMTGDWHGASQLMVEALNLKMPHTSGAHDIEHPESLRSTRNNLLPPTTQAPSPRHSSTSRGHS